MLLAQDVGRHRFAARYDDFATRQTTVHSPPPWSREGGSAVTLAWTVALDRHVELVAEWLRIDSRYTSRAALGEQPDAVEHGAQLALRLTL